MSRNLIEPLSLHTKFPVGEIIDMAGVPAIHNDGNSVWMRTGTWVDADDVPDSVVETLKNSEYYLTALTDNLEIDETYSYIPGLLPSAVAGSVRCFPYSSSSKGTTAWVVTVNSSGVNIKSTGQTCGYPQTGISGGGNAVVSNGTKIWSFVTNAGGTLFTAKSSTDGITWTSETLTGQAPFAGIHSYPINMGGNQVSDGFRHGVVYNGVTNVMIVVWCGARYLFVGRGASYLIAQRTSDGTTFGGDETTTVLGSATLAPTNYWWSYRNGNNFFIAGENFNRKSADGGVTWAAAGSITASATTGFRVNSSDVTRIMACNYTSLSGVVSVNSGQTWGVISFPVIPGEGAILYGRGSTWVLTTLTGDIYRSTDDGATWQAYTGLNGIIGGVKGVYADANRWYAVSPNSNQIATSTDFSTWTVRNIKNSAPGTTSSYLPFSIAFTDANNIIMCGSNYILFSTDGGVTWTWVNKSSASTGTGESVTQIIPCTTGTNAFISGNTSTNLSTKSLYIKESDMAGGAKFVRSSNAVVAPIRTNAMAYSRVK